MRKTLINIHLYIAAFVAPAFLLVAISGGLYLFGFKGSVESEVIALPTGTTVDFNSNTLDDDVRALIDQLGIDHQFEYLKNRGNIVQTRPTSRVYLEFASNEEGLTLTQNTPSLQKHLIELHKGHGPMAFKTYQKLVAISLILVVVSGLWLGLTSPMLRKKSLISVGLGTLLFVLLAMF